jgi:hypothetical protein
MQFDRQRRDLPRELGGVRLQLTLLFDEILVRLLLLESGCAVLPDHQEAERKIASSDTTSVSVGHGLDPGNHLHGEDEHVQIDE